jgi:Icc-related predicted phosphoesterase
MTTRCYFVSDLHGRVDRYAKLFESILESPPAAVFMGGDLLPHDLVAVEIEGRPCRDFLNDYLVPEFTRLRGVLGRRYPRVFLILGNDDSRAWEAEFLDASATGIWEYAHGRKMDFGRYRVFGYSFVPPTPFLLKDWERFDVSRYVDPGCVSPEEGIRSCPVPERESSRTTIQEDLAELSADDDLENAVFLFHTPPYRTRLDRAALDGKTVDHVALDVHVGSIAVRRFIETRQPHVTLHGHVHESSGLTGSWRDRMGRTRLFSAAYDGPELALVTFDLRRPDDAVRLLL